MDYGSYKEKFKELTKIVEASIIYDKNTPVYEIQPGSIASLYNHLGNASQLINSIESAFNSSEQQKMVNQAAVELEEMINDLSNLRHIDNIDYRTFTKVMENTNSVISELKSMTDTSYI